MFFFNLNFFYKNYMYIKCFVSKGKIKRQKQSTRGSVCVWGRVAHRAPT